MSHRLITGAEFNVKYQGQRLIKLTNESETHNNFEFQTGLNVDRIPFYPSGECQPGGLYFCLYDSILSWLNYGDQVMFYVRSVEIPDNAHVWLEGSKFKADCLILGDRLPIADLDLWNDPENNLRICQQNAKALRFVKQQTEEMCLLAVDKNSHSLQYVKEQTAAICLVAVMRNGCALQYVKEQTKEICLAACKSDGHALQFVQDHTDEIYLAAVNQTGFALQYMKQQTPQLCLIAVRRNSRSLQHVKEQTEAICLAAVRKNGHALQYVKKQTKAICSAAVKCDRSAAIFIRNELCVS